MTIAREWQWANLTQTTGNQLGEAPNQRCRSPCRDLFDLSFFIGIAETTLYCPTQSKIVTKLPILPQQPDRQFFVEVEGDKSSFPIACISRRSDTWQKVHRQGGEVHREFSVFPLILFKVHLLPQGDRVGLRDCGTEYFGARSAVVLTAWNPMGEEVDLEENERKNAELAMDLADLSVDFLPCIGSSADTSYREASNQRCRSPC